MRYLILQHPGHNRVYYNLADKLALAELKLAGEKMSVQCEKLEIVEIESVRYLSIETDTEISENDFQIMSRLSFVFAIYRLENWNDTPCLIPVSKYSYEFLDSKISSLLKYPGKTNELFTKMMLNVALMSSDFDHNQKIQMLDPVAGRGTTLFEALVYGFDAYGIEIEQKSVHELSVFFKKYLETEHMKHVADKRRISGANKSEAVNVQEFEFAFNKQDFKTKENRTKLSVVCGNSQDAQKYFKKEKFHLIVGDLPYGIFHGNTGAKKNESFTRNPSELLAGSVAQWHKVLKKGGCVVVAWNSCLAGREDLGEIFTAQGFELMNDELYGEFEHMVDKSIKRDIVVAKKV